MRRTITPSLTALHMNIDKLIRLVYTDKGPVYMNLESMRKSVYVRRVRNLYYTKGFAEVVFREALLHNAKFTGVWKRLHVRAYENGNELGSLFTSHTKCWFPIIDDIFSSSAVTDLHARLLHEAADHDEGEYVSIDATVRCCFNVMGQASYRSSKEVRAQAAFNDADSKRCVLTVRGRTSAVLGMYAIASEKSEAVRNSMGSGLPLVVRNQIKHIACDDPSKALLNQLKQICRNLSTMSLDPTHLAIVYEYAHWRKRTPGSNYLRKIAIKFNKRDASLEPEAWGHVFEGSNARCLSREEETARCHIVNMSMSKHRANLIERQLDADVPFYTRIEFIEALASLTCLYKDEVQRKVTGSNKQLFKILWCAAAPERIEWLFNNIRARRMISAARMNLLPSGSMSNEALHSEINSWFRTTVQMHQTTLSIKLKMLCIGKLLQHNSALYHPTSRQVPSSLVLARTLSKDQWTTQSWNKWCRTLKQGNRIRKASLSLTTQKCHEEVKVKKWMQKKPAAAKHKHTSPAASLKRTPFSLARVGKLIRSGVVNVIRKHKAMP